MCLALARWKRVPRLVLREPLIAFAVVYLFTFVYAFASIENFGILARQRAQVLPALFVILAIRAVPARTRIDPIQLGSSTSA